MCFQAQYSYSRALSKIDLRAAAVRSCQKANECAARVKSASQGTSRRNDKDGCGPVVEGRVVECLGVIVSAVPYVLHRVGLGGLNLSFAIS